MKKKIILIKNRLKKMFKFIFYKIVWKTKLSGVGFVRFFGRELDFLGSASDTFTVHAQIKICPCVPPCTPPGHAGDQWLQIPILSSCPPTAFWWDSPSMGKLGGLISSCSCLFIQIQQFSMGLRSGKFLGHSMRLIFATYTTVWLSFQNWKNSEKV